MSENTYDETETELRGTILEGLMEYHSWPDHLDPLWGMRLDAETIPGYVILVSIDHEQEPILNIYTWEQLKAWYERALQYLKEHPISPEWDQDDEEVYDDDDEKRCTLGEAMGETQEESVETSGS